MKVPKKEHKKEQKKRDSAESRNVNLKSNTMKNTLQRYDEFSDFPNKMPKIIDECPLFCTI